MANLLAKYPNNTAGMILTLVTADGSICYRAAHVRQLTDQRQASLGLHFGDLSINDQAIIYEGF
jgi:hypothetical protein